MGTTLLILCLPLNHKHNTDPPKLPARCQTDSLNPAHKNSPLGVRQIRIILLHPNLIHRTQCLTPEPKTKSPPKHQNPPLLHPNSPLGVRQIRSIPSTQTTSTEHSVWHQNLGLKAQPDTRTHHYFTQTSRPVSHRSAQSCPPKLSARCQTDSHNLAPPKPHPPNTVSDTSTQSPTWHQNPVPKTQNPTPPTKV